jgi:hypothetical protein
MHVDYRSVGLGLATLGVAGIVVCLAGIATVWFAASRLQQVNLELFRQLHELIDQVDRRAEQARVAAGETRDLVNELKQTLRDSATDLVAERMASLPEIDNLERRLALALERAHGLVQLSTSTAELIEQLLVALGAFMTERNVDLKDATGLMASIQPTRESLAIASERLSDVQRLLSEIRQKRDAADKLPQIMKLSLGIVTKLEVVQDQIATFRGRLDETKFRLSQLQNRLKAWIFGSQCLILLLIAWAGAGQYCLLAHGWRLLRPPSVGPIAERSDE